MLTSFSNDTTRSTEVDPKDFGGTNKLVPGTNSASFVVGDYIDIRNTTGYFASMSPAPDNPLGYRLQPLCNTLVFYGYQTPTILFPPIEPGAVAAYMIMRKGDAILLSPDGKILWTTKTSTGYRIDFNTLGDIVMTDLYGNVVWQQSDAKFASTAFIQG